MDIFNRKTVRTEELEQKDKTIKSLENSLKHSEKFIKSLEDKLVQKEEQWKIRSASLNFASEIPSAKNSAESMIKTSKRIENYIINGNDHNEE